MEVTVKRPAKSRTGAKPLFRFLMQTAFIILLAAPESKESELRAKFIGSDKQVINRHTIFENNLAKTARLQTGKDMIY